MQISPFWFCLNFHLHQGLLWSSPNVDVNETAVELEISFKMLCLATPLCKMLQRGMWQPNQRWAWPWWWWW